MATDSIQIARCGPEHRLPALALVMADLPTRTVAATTRDLLAEAAANEDLLAGLFVALRSGRLVAVCWAQRQAGNTALVWQPRVLPGVAGETAVPLLEAVNAHLDTAGVAMSQVLLKIGDEAASRLLVEAGYWHLANLVYLTCDEADLPDCEPATPRLAFEPYDVSQRARLAALIERTYVDTLDCSPLSGMRNMEDVLDGYQSTGAFDPAHWQFVCSDGQDIGVILMAEVPQSHWELMYMGLVPEARGGGRGLAVTRYAQWLTRQCGGDRIVLAVDEANWPAVRMYQAAGFREWDRRGVYIRTPPPR